MDVYESKHMVAEGIARGVYIYKVQSDRCPYKILSSTFLRANLKELTLGFVLISFGRLFHILMLLTVTDFPPSVA
jgi:hypothetical protein